MYHHYVLALVITSHWFLVSRAVNVGDVEGISSTECPNVTTVSTSNNSFLTNSVQLTVASTCMSSTVNVTTNATGIRILDLRRRGIEDVANLPKVNTVRLDNNKIRTFTTANDISKLYLSNNSIPTINAFKFPTNLTFLNLANNSLEDISKADLPSSLEFLNLSHNPITFLSNTSFPSNLRHLDVTNARLETLENLTFPNSLSRLNLSSNPIHLIRGVLFPDSLTHLALLTVPRRRTVPDTTDSQQPEETETRELQSNIRASFEPPPVLQEFEVRQTDADRFETLLLWNVSPTSTLNCSDGNANPRYVHDTMLCVLSDREFALKYEHVLLANHSMRSEALWGPESPLIERQPLVETLSQRRSWFLLSATACLTVLATLFCLHGFCRCLGRYVCRGKNRNKSTTIAFKSIIRLPPSESESESDSESAQPLTQLQTTLASFQVASSLLTGRELLPTVEEHFSPFLYFHAFLHHQPVVLKSLRLVRQEHDLVARFCDEIRLSVRLSHPQIMLFHGFVVGNEKKSIALIMENMHHGDLNTLIQHHKRHVREEGHQDDWTWRASSSTTVYKSKFAILLDVAHALHYLHSLSPPLFHGNLSSRKLFVDATWTVKLGDFTCCSALRRLSLDAADALHSKSDIRARPSHDAIHMDMTVWTAPEVLDGRQYTHKADIYSFGVLLVHLASYECTVSEHHFGLDDDNVPLLNPTLDEHLDRVPIMNPTLEEHLDAPSAIRLLVSQCQASDPDARPTAEAILATLWTIEHKDALQVY